MLPRTNKSDVEPEASSDGVWAAEAISKIGAIAAGVAALVFFFGYMHVRLYYSVLGVPWYVSSLGNGAVLAAGSVYTLFAFLGCVLGLTFRYGPWRRMLDIAIVVCLLVGLGAYTVEISFARLDTGDPRWFGISEWANISAYTLAVSMTALGCSVVKLVTEMRHDSFVWRREHRFQAVLLVMVPIMFAPMVSAQIQASRDLDPVASRLPRVNGVAQLAGDIRLVHIEGDQALLARLPSMAASASFRLIKLDDKVMIDRVLASRR